MARGRQQKWICLDCGAAFSIQGAAPKMCCICGSSRLGRLAAVCKDLNEMYGRYAELKARYDEIMAYWKQQRRRGYITPEEYEELSLMFLGNRPV